MTKEEVEQFVDNLPELDGKRFRTGLGYDDRYMYVYREKKRRPATRYFHLLNTGELVEGTYRTDSKLELKNEMKAGAEYLGIGILHKD